MTSVTKTVMSQIEDERRRQDAKWGEQNWEDGSGPKKKFANASSVNTDAGDGSVGNVELFGFPGMIFEVLKNGAVSCLTVY